MTGPRLTSGSDSKQDYGTPDALVSVLEEVKGRPFDVDLAATEDNSKARQCITPEMDSLRISWAGSYTDGEMCWLNPPFANIGDWAEKCAQETTGAHNWLSIYLLVPASIGAAWYRHYVYPYATTYALYPRIPFDGWHETAYIKDCMLCEYGPDARPTIVEPLEWITPAEALACREAAQYNQWQRYKKWCKREGITPVYEEWIVEWGRPA